MEGPAEYEAIARRAEAAGIDVLSVYHDLLDQPAIAPLLLMARVTERVRLGPAALNPFTLHPYEIAGQIAMLDSVSNGRAFLGLAKGAWLDRLGIEEERPLVGLKEAVAIIRALLSGDQTGVAGERFTLAPGTALSYPRIRESVPLLIGTWGRQTARWAGTVADEVKIGGTANPDLVPIIREWVDNPAVRIVAGSVSVVDEERVGARTCACGGRALPRNCRSSRSDARAARWTSAAARAVLHRGHARRGRVTRRRAVGRRRRSCRARNTAGPNHAERDRPDLRASAAAPSALTGYESS